jgi:hypothetical protein
MSAFKKLVPHGALKCRVPALAIDFYFFDVFKAILAQVVHHILDQHLRSRSAGGDGNRVHAGEPRRMDGLRVINEVPDGAQVAGDFNQAIGVGAVCGSHNQY